MKTVTIRKMVLIADENGNVLEMSKSEALLAASKIENASISRNNFKSSPVYDKKGKFIKSVYDRYFVRIK